MSLTIFPLWDSQFQDDDGAPLAGGLVYSYETGTDTPSPLYHDSDGTIPWTNPIELNAAGRFTDAVYQAATPALKIIVTDADTVQVLPTIDPVQAYGAATEPEPPGVAPTITDQPDDQSLSAGQSATVLVVATGTAPLSYQWYLGSSGDTSSPIDGAIGSAYTTLPLAAGTYTGWVRVSNDFGSADSLTVTLTVT